MKLNKHVREVLFILNTVETQNENNGSTAPTVFEQRSFNFQLILWEKKKTHI